MATLTPNQRAWRSRAETVIRLMAPALDLLLAAGDRMGRIGGRDDDWEPPVRAANGRRDAGHGNRGG
jgi:hypothetical protein